MDSFVLLTYASLAASRTLWQRLLGCLNFTLDSEDLFCWYKQKSDFYELWQQHKQLKTIKISEAWPDICNEGYRYLKPLIKLTKSRRSTEFKNIVWSISQMLTKTIPINMRIVKSFMMKQASHFESDRKSMETEKTWSEFLHRGKVIVEQILASEERKKLKRVELWQSKSGIHVWNLTIWVRSFEI